MFLGLCTRCLIPITVIKYPAQSCVCVQSASEIDEGIVTLRRGNFAPYSL